MRGWKKYCITLLLIFAVLCYSATALGVSIGPFEIVISDALRGGVYERTITVTNPDENEGTFILTAEGDFTSGIEFAMQDDPATVISTVTIPGKDKEYVIVRITIPENAANGDYTATLIAATIPGGSQGEMGVGTSFLATTDVRITVTDIEVVTGNVERVTVHDTESGLYLPIEVVFQNTGNVIEKPDISVAISKDGKLIDRIRTYDTPVDSGTKATINLEWDTTGQESGEYTAKVSVSLGEKTVDEKEVPFKILPVGTMTRNGMLTELCCEGEAVPGGILKVVGTFYNIGQIETKAKLVGEVLKDGALVDTIDGDEFSVPVNAKEELVSYIDIDEAGEYEISAYVLYEGKKTDTRTLQVSAIDASAQASPLSAVTGLAALGFLALLLYRRVKRRE